MKRVKNKKRRVPVKRATLPTTAERLYVGAMRAWSREFRGAVLAAIQAYPDPRLFELCRLLEPDGARLDAKQPTFLQSVAGFGSRVLKGIRFQFGALGATVDRVGQDTSKHVKTQLKRVLGIPPERVTTAHGVAEWRKMNVSLITKMTEEQLAQIEGLLDGLGTVPVQVVADKLEQQFDMTRSRAELIARDQVLKLNSQLTQDAHRQAGVEEYFWSDSEDDSVRDRHAELGRQSRAGRRFRYDDPPVVDEKSGRTANPGEDYECRCLSIPYLPELKGLDM
jgi:SPP1 gp7 family putative phage head morphogenesis protein